MTLSCCSGVDAEFYIRDYKQLSEKHAGINKILDNLGGIQCAVVMGMRPRVKTKTLKGQV